MDTVNAPGWPGIPATWTSSTKTGVGCALSATSTVWFSLSHGIVNELYYPRVDHACTRDLGLILSTDGGDFWEEKRAAANEIRSVAAGVPGYVLRNRLPAGHLIEKVVITDPGRNAFLQHTKLEAPNGELSGLHLTILLAPHLVNRGAGNTAWLGEYKGMEMLFAEGAGVSLAMACDVPWVARSVGFVGVSDGWQDVSRHGRITHEYERAENGNVALSAEVDLSGTTEFTIAVGFGAAPAEAAHAARASLLGGFDRALEAYSTEWKSWRGELLDLDDSFATDSAAVLRVHESQSFPGGIIASLSIPWGFSKGDDDLGGYHLVWPRDLVENMGGLLAIGATDDAGRVVEYLRTTQESTGAWPQNMWLDGTAYWGGIQMDETAFPILALDAAVRHGCPIDPNDYWPMVKAAAGFLVRNGPVTGQDRWEEDPGYSPFTLAVEIAALLVAADHAESAGEQEAATFLRDTADAWNAGVERWTYVGGTELAKKVGVEGYYVRIASPESAEAASPAGGWVPIKNRPPDEAQVAAVEIVSPDALALVRFGLRSADDPRIVDTVRVIDHVLRVELPQGPAWHRYNEDGYGEHEDGSPFDGTGIGRPWPLLTGERAHFELAAGNLDEAARLADVLREFAGPGGLLPEQVWDGPARPDRELVTGGPTGSARPLAWAHAEYIKLRRSLRDGTVFDRPPQPYQRYVEGVNVPDHVVWSPNLRCRTIPAGKVLRIQVSRAATIVWTTDGWSTTRETPTLDSTLGVHFADLETGSLAAGSEVEFATHFLDGDWEGQNQRVHVAEEFAVGAVG